MWTLSTVKSLLGCRTRTSCVSLPYCSACMPPAQTHIGDPCWTCCHHRCCLHSHSQTSCSSDSRCRRSVLNFGLNLNSCELLIVFFFLHVSEDIRARQQDVHEVWNMHLFEPVGSNHTPLSGVSKNSQRLPQAHTQARACLADPVATNEFTWCTSALLIDGCTESATSGHTRLRAVACTW
jgi:hypothetical protein